MNHNLQRLLKKQLEWFLSPKSMGLEKADGLHAPYEQAELISECYKQLSQSLEYQNSKTSKFSIERSIENDIPLANNSYIDPVNEMIQWAKDSLQDYISSFWIHGSIASQDYIIGWSDLDTYLIVKKETLKDSKNLCELRNLLLKGYDYLIKVDPLQHHGFLTCSEYDINNYLPGYLPLKVLQESKQVFGNKKINFLISERLNNSRILPKIRMLLEESEKSGVFKHHPLKGEYLLNNYENKNNAMYQMKNFISLINILPIYYYNDRGIECSKKDSFSMIYKEKNMNFDLLKTASNVRNMWSSKENHPFRGNTIPEWLIKEFGLDYFSRTLVFVDDLIQSIKSVNKYG